MTETDEARITAAFWKQLRGDRTVMLGLENAAPPTLRPMTALVDGERAQGPIWFFTSRESALVQRMEAREPAIFTFASKGHDLFATVHGALTRSRDRAVIDRLWNPWIAAWYENGKDDPDLALLRFDPADAEIWRDASSLLAGLKMLFGGNPRDDYRDDVAKVSLS
jgi:general stress protein 26